MNLIPTTDLADYLLLPKAVQDEIDTWHPRLQSISPPIQRALDNVAAALGVSAKTARRKYDLWRKQGWRGLINRAKAPAAASSLSPEFLEWWKGLCGENARKCAPAYRKFVRMFLAGEPIPGIEPCVPRGSIPIGYSYDNLIRYKPTAFELAASRIGRTAASNFRPKLAMTRHGLHVGERLMFDDMWHDFKISVLGQRGSFRLLQLHAHDLFSACQFARGMKARIRDEGDEKSIGLKESEMLFLVCHVLTKFGYYFDGCVIMVEHGTAAISQELEQALYDLTNGRVVVERSGIQGGRDFGETKPDRPSTFQQLSAFAGQYPGRGKGNFHFKASLESLGNLIHNETADLLTFPGQTGSNSRINCPEELAGREKHGDTLSLALIALANTNSQIANALRLPFLEVNQAKWLVEEVMERINRRTEHDLEGWLECGLTTTDFHIPGVGIIPSGEFLTMATDRRAAVESVATPAPRKLSPREVFEAGRKQLVKFRPEQSATLLLKSNFRPRCGQCDDGTVIVGKDHMINLEDKEICPSPLRYLAHHLAVGDKFQAVVNPWSLEVLHLFDARGGWVGQVDLWQKVPHVDHEALQEQMGAAAKVERELLAPLAARGAQLTRKRLEDARHNTETIRGDAAQTEASIEATKDILRKAADTF